MEERELTAWERVQLSRHPQRPYTLDYVERIFSSFVELHGDRHFRDDPAIVGGLAQLSAPGLPEETRTVMVVGHQKGRDTRDKVQRNFGMPRPEGFRKAARLMKHAERFGFPVLAFIDTPGAAPDMEAEERGQAQAIAENLILMAQLRVPIVATIIGEGNSGGALAIGVADRILILEFAYFSVVSPEGCASILWRDAARAPEAAEAMRITAPQLLRLGVVDTVIAEPPGGAHTDPVDAAGRVGQAIWAALADLSSLEVEEMLRARHEKYRRMGCYQEGGVLQASMASTILV